VNDDLEKRQGTWNIVALEVEGQKMSEQLFKGPKIAIAGSRLDTIS
jgi:hypothetical protein